MNVSQVTMKGSLMPIDIYTYDCYQDQVFKEEIRKKTTSVADIKTLGEKNKCTMYSGSGFLSKNLSLSLSLCLSLSVCVCVCVSVCVSLCVSLPLCLSLCLSLSVSLTLTVSHSVTHFLSFFFFFFLMY